MSALPTLTALSASAAAGPSVTFTATVSDLTAGGATPNGGTVTFSDQNGTIGSETLVNGVATYTTSGLAAGTITVSASYGGTASLRPEHHGHDRDGGRQRQRRLQGRQRARDRRRVERTLWHGRRLRGRPVHRRQGNNVVREVVKATGDITTVAGDGKAGYSGDSGPATAAELDDPRGLAFDSAGDLFIADMNNNGIREVVKATGDIITVAGDGKAGYSGDDGPATAAELSSPRGLAVDSAGDVFFADNPNNRVREVVAGDRQHHHRRRRRQGGLQRRRRPATAAELNGPNSVAVDSAGNLFFADANNNAVREVVAGDRRHHHLRRQRQAGYSGDEGLPPPPS